MISRYSKPKFCKTCNHDAIRILLELLAVLPVYRKSIWQNVKVIKIDKNVRVYEINETYDPLEACQH